jgi:hypothetical protein
MNVSREITLICIARPKSKQRKRSNNKTWCAEHDQAERYNNLENDFARKFRVAFVLGCYLPPISCRLNWICMPNQLGITNDSQVRQKCPRGAHNSKKKMKRGKTELWVSRGRYSGGVLVNCMRPKSIDPRKRFLKMSTSYIHFEERFLRPQQQENVRKTSRYI